MNDEELFAHHATILKVSDMERSLFFYVKQLGFANSFSWEEPISYAVVKRGAVSLHLSLAYEKPDVIAQSSVYIFVHDPDKVLDSFQKNGVAIAHPIGDRVYHMQDFDILDPDGHLLTFGKGNSN